MIDKETMGKRNRTKRTGFFSRVVRELRRVVYIMLDEYRIILKDSGLAVVLLGAPLLYPVLYSSIYRNETVRDMPIAVVDASQSSRSRELTRLLDATPDLKVVYRLNNLEEAKDPFYRQKIHGVVHIPGDYPGSFATAGYRLNSDMSSFMYYRTDVGREPAIWMPVKM